MNELKLSIEIIEAIQCPVCSSHVSVAGMNVICLNSGCLKVFPLVDGIPVLINEKSSVFLIADFIERKPTFFDNQGGFISTIRRAIPSISVNLVAVENYRRLNRLLRQSVKEGKPRVLVLGGSIHGNGFEELLRESDIELVETDVSYGEHTALICDAHDIPFITGTFDAVIVQAVLEHVADPSRCVSEIWRVLRDDGLVYAETAFMQQVHGGAYDFTRFTPLGHRRLFRNFIEIGAGVACGPGMALAWAWRYFLQSFCTKRTSRMVAAAISHFTAFYLKYFDRYLVKNPSASEGASAVWFLGKKAIITLSDRELVNQRNSAYDQQIL